MTVGTRRRGWSIGEIPGRRPRFLADMRRLLLLPAAVAFACGPASSGPVRSSSAATTGGAAGSSPGGSSSGSGSTGPSTGSGGTGSTISLGSSGGAAGAPSGGSGGSATSGVDGGAAPGWHTLYAEDFESGALALPAWAPDPVPDDGPFADQGKFFTNQGIQAPVAFRLSQPFGQAGWLTLESYTREGATDPGALASVVVDPANPANHALRIASPHHTDATVVRPSQPLPDRYRVTVRVGFADFGDGLAGLNGYQGGETAGPWLPGSATGQNGFYWLAILDAPPRPHNNVYIHHHRKVVMDSDNNYPPWMEEWNGSAFVPSGEHPLMMFALDGKAPDTELYGRPFLPYSDGAWQPSGTIRAVDQYLPGEWYTASIERDGTQFTLSVSGRFKYGGDTSYTATLDAAAHCVWHYDRSAAEDASACVDPSYFPDLGPSFPEWPAGATWPDWFMFGDPHENFYEGSVLYDTVRLEVWQ